MHLIYELAKVKENAYQPDPVPYDRSRMNEAMTTGHGVHCFVGSARHPLPPSFWSSFQLTLKSTLNYKAAKLL